MKKLLEFGVFDILKDPKNEKFLDKVKKENRDLYPQFLNILKRKGLEVAMKEYEQYDPNYVKIRQQREKEEKALRKKQGTKEFKEKIHQAILARYKDKIDEVENVLLFSELNTLGNRIKNFKNIGDYLDSCKARKQYTNKFKETLKKNRIGYELDSVNNINIDTLMFVTTYYDYQTGERDQKSMIIRVEQWYTLKTKESVFSIYINLFDDEDEMSYTPKIDHNKISGFLTKRKALAKTYNLEKVELKDIFLSLQKLNGLLDERTYDNWYKDYKFRQDTNKYNL